MTALYNFPLWRKRRLHQLMKALRQGNLSAFRQLFVGLEDLVNEKDSLGNTLLHLASSFGNDEARPIAFSLLDAGAAVNPRNVWGMTPLHRAAQTRDVLLIRRLLEAGAEVNAVDESQSTPLYVAAASGHPESVRALLANGADPAIAGGPLKRTPYEAAQTLRRIDVLDALRDTNPE